MNQGKAWGRAPWLALVFSAAAMLAACGGGGGSPGVPVALPSVSSGNHEDVVDEENGQTPVAAGKVTIDVLGGAGVSATTLSAIEIAQVKAILTDAQGAPVPGAIVTFNEAVGSLLTFAPTSKTALTDDTGTAVVEARAASIANLGATAVVASAEFEGETLMAQKAIAITSAPSVGAVDPQTLASAINFLDVNPSDRSIVLAGSGGHGRTESATLRFRVVDANNSPVKGAAVTFAVVPASDVTLNIPTATSDTEGVVTTTVSSKNVATAVVVTATVDGKSVGTQSGQLLVTTGMATQAGFDMSAEKYNLISNLTGDRSSVTVRIVDANGNPVADGVPVVFTADHGAVGSSSRGGCVTSGGQCSVDYVVQDPRPADGSFARVTAETRVGDGSTIGKTLDFRFVNVDLLDVFHASVDGAVRSTMEASTCGAQTFTLFAGTPGNFPPPAGTTVSITAISTGLTVTLKSPATIADQLSSPPSRVPLDFELKLDGPTVPPCTGGSNGDDIDPQAFFDVHFTAGGVTQTRRLGVRYKTPMPSVPLPPA